MSDVWHIDWTHGRFDVHARGGMLAGVELRSDGHVARPFYEAPWLGSQRRFEPDILNHLRSEFPAVPFGVSYDPGGAVEAWRPSLGRPIGEADGGADPSDDLLHGYCASNPWTLVRQTATEVDILIDYPEGSPIKRLRRTVAADPRAAAIAFSLTIEARRKARRPMGLHPNIRLPATPHSIRLEPGPFAFGVVHPAGPEPGVSRARPGAVFSSLGRVPMADGGEAAFDRLPFRHDTEEILQLCGSDGTVAIEDYESGACYRLTWDRSVLPSLLLWISNRGRVAEPWNGSNLCLGVEPVAAAFDMGSPASLAPNPIHALGVPTAVELDPEIPVTVSYRFEMS